MNKFEQKPTKNVKIGYADYYMVIQNIYIAITPRPNWFRRCIFRIVGIEFLRNDVINKRMEEE